MHGSDRLRDALTDRIAAQWIALGVSLVGPPDETLIDLEALIAATALFGRDESRIVEGALDWCIRYGTAVSAGRLKVVAAEIDQDLTALGEFAGLVAGGGGPRWPVPGRGPLVHASRGKVLVRDLRAPALLSWRLRAAFGVAARADILAVLATSDGRAFTLAELARLVRSSKRNVSLAVRSLALADAVRVDVVGNEQRVRLTAHPGFRDWLGPTPPAFVDWTSRFTVAASVLRLDALAVPSPLVRAIDARALVERLSPVIRRTGLPEPDTTSLGEAFGPAYDRWRDALTDVIGP